MDEAVERKRVLKITDIDLKYFTDKELTHSNTAISHRIDNTPTHPRIWDNLHLLVEKILDPARERLGLPIIVNCAYRCPKVNALCGGVANSQHTKGMAADVRCSDNLKLMAILKTMDFDQLGIYPTFLHISYDPEKKRQRHQIFYGR